MGWCQDWQLSMPMPWLPVAPKVREKKKTWLEQRIPLCEVFVPNRKQHTDNAFPTVVRFSSDIPKVDSHKMAVRTKVGSPWRDFIVDDKAWNAGNAFSEVRLGFCTQGDCLWFRNLCVVECFGRICLGEFLVAIPRCPGNEKAEDVSADKISPKAKSDNSSSFPFALWAAIS